MVDADDEFIELLKDLNDEADELSSTVEWLSDRQLSAATPAEGWDIRTTIGHLKWTDEVALKAVMEPDEFTEWLNRLLNEASAGDVENFVDDNALEGGRGDFPFVLSRWTTARTHLQQAMRDKGRSARVPWFGPSMSVISMATARLMETWAHGQDIRDAIGVEPRATPRLRHIAHLGVRTRDFAYLSNGIEPPAQEFRVELSLPKVGVDQSEQILSFGPEDAEQSVTGCVLDFCLLVTRRRHLDDLRIVTVGDDARRWTEIAQAFAGPPGTGRAPKGEGRD